MKRFNNKAVDVILYGVLCLIAGFVICDLLNEGANSMRGVYGLIFVIAIVICCRLCNANWPTVNNEELDKFRIERQEATIKAENAAKAAKERIEAQTKDAEERKAQNHSDAEERAALNAKQREAIEQTLENLRVNQSKPRSEVKPAPNKKVQEVRQRYRPKRYEEILGTAPAKVATDVGNTIKSGAQNEQVQEAVNKTTDALKDTASKTMSFIKDLKK